MARIPMVTRTFTVTKATVMCVDVNTDQTQDNEFRVTSEFKNDQKLLARLKELYETDSVKLVYLKNKELTKELYGMPEDEFMKIAEKLPTRKNRVPVVEVE